MVVVQVLKERRRAMAVVREEGSVVSSLAKLKLTEELLGEAVRRGENARNSTTSHHPRNAGGWYAYAEATAALRDLLVPLGGRAIHEDGYERCVCADGLDEIAVLGGDKFTGDPDRDPQPKFTKPRVVAQGVVERSQLEMFKRDEEERRRAHRHLWFLLVRREKDYARVELSRPGAITDSGRVNAWEERIILKPIPVSSTPIQQANDQTEPVEIEVEPRTE